jgi:DNA-binding NtrC family response regulator
LSETLLESELFGHVRGSFTDAVKDRTGRFEAAHTGTIFLDEISSTSSILQVKLLRVLQEREFERVGDTTTIRVDVRVVAASNRDLYQEASEGRFREDLFWRLNVIPIHLPPLRRRREDIPQLVEHFLKHFCQINRREVDRVSPEAMQAMVNYAWPGNVRELQNYVERAVVLAQGSELTIDLLPTLVSGQGKTELRAFRGADPQSLIEEFVTNELHAAGDQTNELLARIVNPVERELIVQVLRQCSQIQTKAADRLGINRNTLSKKMKELGIDSED